MQTPENDLHRAFLALGEKQKSYDEKWAYYDGNAPTVYSTAKLREIFGRIDSRWTENWCAVVIDAENDRINISRFTFSGNKELDKDFERLWQETELNIDSDEANKAALVCGESFVIVGKDQDGKVEAYYNDPRNAWIHYDPDRPKRKAYAAKWWVDENGKRRITLYYPGRFEYYVSKKKASDMDLSTGGKPSEWDSAGQSETNEWGEVPVFHFRPERRVKSQLVSAIDLQNAINKLFADMMIASEFSTMRQRYIVANAEALGTVNGTGAALLIPAGDKDQEPTQVGEFESADLEKCTAAMDKLVNDLATITRTPKHYFYKQGGDPSGEALIAMEAPLVKKTQNHIERLRVEWRKVAAFLLKVSGVEVDPLEIEPVFDSPETVQPRTRAEIRQISTSAGMPLETVLTNEEGWSQEELAAMKKVQEAEDKRTAELFAQKAGAAGAAFDAGRSA